MLRTDSDKVTEFLKYIKIPLINGLSPSSSTQVLSDIFTVEEIKKRPISKLNICWMGLNNVLNSLIAADNFIQIKYWLS